MPRWSGTGLCRPECVLAHSSGLLLVPNWRSSGGISLITPDGGTHHLLSQNNLLVRPNGIALEAGGTILLAHMGDTEGGIYRLNVAGQLQKVVLSANGEPLPPTNFVVKDSQNRIWITVSTRLTPRAADYRAAARTGFIAVAQPGSTDATIVADGLGYTNECVVDEAGGYVFVNETFGRRLTRFELDSADQPLLSNPTTLCHFGKGTYPDGLALDAAGNLWVSSIVSNRIIKVSPAGEMQIEFEDSDAQHIDWTEAAYLRDSLGREHLDNVRSKQIKNLSNLAFGGLHRKRLYMGNLLGDSLPYIDTEHAGAAMLHWDVDLGELETYMKNINE